MLSLRDVGVRFGPKSAVESVDLDLPEGEVLAVLGPSGCGKSTLLRAIAGLEELHSGSVSVDGRDLAGVPTHRRGFALMFQDGQLFRHLDVAGNVGYPLRLRPRRVAGGRGRAGTSSQTPEAVAGAVDGRVSELLETVGLPGYESREVTTLSGGEQQRVALARALAAQPRLLLLDEPLSALDRTLRERLASDLRGILTSTGTTALLVTHDHDEAFTLADQLAVMFSGRIVQHGPTREVWTRPATRQVAEFIGFGTFLEGDAARRVVAAAIAAAPVPPAAAPAAAPVPPAAAPAAAPVPTAMRPDGRDETALTSRGAHLVASGWTLNDGQQLALRRSALRVDPAGSLAAVVQSAAAVSDAVRVELDLEGVGPVEGLADQDADLSPGAAVRVRADRSGMALVPAPA